MLNTLKLKENTLITFWAGDGDTRLILITPDAAPSVRRIIAGKTVPEEPEPPKGGWPWGVGFT